VLGGALAAPMFLRAQVQTGPGNTPESPADTLRRQDSTLVPGKGAPSVERRPSRRPKKDETGALTLIRPPALRAGSTIAIVAPASGVSRGDALDAAATLRNLGFNVKLGKHLTKDFGYLAARDQQRADELMQFVRDPEVNCIMAVRGGYGVMRILPLLDFNEIRANPKVIIGYSDITALVNPVYQKSGLIAFHGPVATSTFDPYTLDSFRRTVMAASAAGEFGESDEFRGSVFSEAQASTIVPGKAQGRLVGGNLSLVTAMMGTPYDIDTQGKILFLEEIAEEPYKVDRMMMQLLLGGKLQACAGIALGRFTKCEAPRRGGEFQLSLSLEQVIRGILEPLKIPTIYGLSIGHIRSKLTVPVGALATIDAGKKTITIDEAAVEG
jgi:muramoyltetrapeptide carboxypeptidase